MNFESPSKILDNQRVERAKTDDDSNMDRRAFLRLSASTAISAGVAITAMNSKKSLWDKAKGLLGKKLNELARRKSPDQLGEEKELDIKEDGILTSDLSEKKILRSPSEEQEDIINQDAQSLKDILAFNQEKIDLNMGTYQAVEAYWKKKYKEDKSLYAGFKKAYKEMSAWEDDLRAVFKREGVPEKYIYLAIPESHWVLRARSRVGATGPYQFIRSTAKKLELSTGTYKGEHKNIDERMDPVLSAEACAKELKYLYGKCDGDWELALSAYNGGFFWRYKGMVNYKREQGEQVDANYEDFMEYLEGKINKLMTELKTNSLYYTVRRGDSLSKIARNYYVKVQDLMTENDLTTKAVIHKNDKIKIPVTGENAKKIYEGRIKGYSENLNYPAKFNAIIALIDEENNLTRKKDFNYEVITVKNKVGINHKLAKGETFYSLHRKYKISVDRIKRANPKLDPNSLRLGARVVIPNKTKAKTLYDVAKEHNKSLARLKALNTSIINFKKPLPDGFEVRI